MKESKSKQNQSIKIFGAGLLIVLLLLYISDISENQTVSRQLLKEIPIGTNISAAQSIMENLGYLCSPDDEKALEKTSESMLFCGKCAKLDDSRYKRYAVYIIYNKANGLIADMQARVKEYPQCTTFFKLET